MNSTMFKIMELCEKVVSDSKVYNKEVHVAKNIACKIENKIKLNKLDLDFVMNLQLKYGM